MTPKMVANFRRSVSFSNPPPPPPPSSTTSKPTVKRHHFRSASLPTRSHPILSQLKFHLSHLKSLWGPDSKSQSLDSTQISDSLIRLRTVLESLDDLLDLPPSRDSLRHHPEWVEKVLDDFLHLVDVYGTFQTQISLLKQYHMTAQLAIRRRDGSKSGVCLKGLRKTGREISKLVPSVQEIQQDIAPNMSDPDLDLAEVIKGVIEIVVVISEALFGGVSQSFAIRRNSWIMGLKSSNKEKGIRELEGGMWSLRRKGDENEDVIKKKMKEMEECLSAIEIGSEKVFRSLINTRVSLLNVLTQ